MEKDNENNRMEEERRRGGGEMEEVTKENKGESKEIREGEWRRKEAEGERDTHTLLASDLANVHLKAHYSSH